MPNSKANYYPYTHNNPDITTIGDFVGSQLSIAIGLSIVSLLTYEDENGTLNLDNLIQLYSADELNQYKSLIDQIRQSTAKQQVSQTTKTTSIIDGNSSSVDVINSTNTPNPDSLVRLTDSTRMNINLSDYQSLINTNQLNAQQQSFINTLLDDNVKKLFTKFIFQIQNQLNYIVQITSARRSLTQQQGLAGSNPNASSGFSYHLAGLAIDIALLDKSTGQIVLTQQPYGNKITAIERTNIISQWSSVNTIASALNLTWGGNSFGSNCDPVHFDARNYYSVDQSAYMNAVSSPTNVSSPIVNSNTNEEEETSDNAIYEDLPLKVGTVLNLCLIELDREVLAVETNQAVNLTDFESFLARELYYLLSDPGYERTFIPKKTVTLGEIREIFPYLTVWIWSRALSIDLSGNYNHTILNITPYISSINTGVGDNGGSFTIDIAPITAELGNEGWQLEIGTQKSAPINGSDYVSEGFLHYKETGANGEQLKRNRHFFEKVLQQNDIIFIRFEKLKLETNRQNLDQLERIPISQLPGQIFDMIGLLDTPSITTNPESANVSINLSGKDLVKLVIEDGIYFYPADFVSGGIFANTGAGNQRLNRFGANGEILSRFQVLNKTIEKSLEYIINSLSSIEICPTSLFQGYANSKDRITGAIIDKRSTSYQLDNPQQNTIQDNQRAIDNLKTQVLTLIDNVRSGNNITEGTDIDVYNIIHDYIVSNGQVIGQAPSNLKDLLFLRNRIWIDNRNNPVSSLQSKDVTDSIENLFSQINSGFSINTPLYQLSRTSLSTYPNNINNYDKYSITDIISQLQDIVNNSILIDDEVSSSPANTIVKDTSNQQVSVQQDVVEIQSKYQVVTAIGQTITLLILEKVLSQLTSNEQNIFNQIYQIVQQENAVAAQQAGTPQLLPVNGIWQIVKLIVDDSVKNRVLADASIGNEMGSLINAIRKICQDPFCEFFTDTYGDQFYFIVRKKPFDLESITSYLENRAVYEKLITTSNNSMSLDIGVDKQARMFNANTAPSSIAGTDISYISIVRSINEIDVIDDTLDYSQEAYSWYRLQLKNLISGSDSDMAFAYLKAVYFNEYADIFGSKPLDISTNYIPYQSLIDKNQSLPTAYFIRQGIYDLKYMIESNAYLPFTRQGTIIVNGDRTYKKGTFVRLESTDEIFYVDGVQHHFSISDNIIERYTTLQVSRGMVEKYIKGVQYGASENSVNFSYFNIINLPIDESVFTSQQAGYTDFNQLILSKWKVNIPVFNFFIKKLQFAKNDNEIFNALDPQDLEYNIFV
jgi:hypothetical protein